MPRQPPPQQENTNSVKMCQPNDLVTYRLTSIAHAGAIEKLREFPALAETRCNVCVHVFEKYRRHSITRQLQSTRSLRDETSLSLNNCRLDRRASEPYSFSSEMCSLLSRCWSMPSCAMVVMLVETPHWVQPLPCNRPGYAVASFACDRVSKKETWRTMNAIWI